MKHPPLRNDAITTESADSGRQTKGARPRPPAKARPIGQSGRWMTVQDAAAFLSLQEVTLRRMLERAARREGDGIVARVDGVVGRKLGRGWRVWLGPAWAVAPEATNVVTMGATRAAGEK